MTHKKKTALLLLILLVVGVGIIVVMGLNFLSNEQAEKVIGMPERNYTIPQVEIMYNYGSKVVYTTDTTVNKNPFIDDCSTRGGVFDSCGNTCDPTAGACTSVCALTCTVK